MLSCHVRLTGCKPCPLPYPRELRTLGDHLKTRRLDLGLFQRDVAQILAVDKMSVCNWEVNRTSPALRFVPRIVEFLGYAPDDTQAESLGQQIVAVRRSLGISQKKLAEELDVDPSTLGRWERGKGRPSRKLGERLLSFLAGKEPDGGQGARI